MTWEHSIRDFKLYLRIERGLSKNTLDNYGLDIEKLMSYLNDNHIQTSPTTIESDIVQQFIYEKAKTLNARSQSRLISGLRSFFSYLIFEDYRKTNPLDHIESPKIGRKLPDTLSLGDIDKLIGAIDLSKTYKLPLVIGRPIGTMSDSPKSDKE